MSRCDYDGVFYRVFCVTLLATAFTFTVILTNVFIDIDGLLSKKAKQEPKENTDHTENGVNEGINLAYNPTGENIYEKNYIDDQSETPYRTKRSIDSPNSPSYINNHQIIKILTNQLKKLLKQSNELLDDDIVENVIKDKSIDDFGYDKVPLKENYADVAKVNSLIDFPKNRKAFNYYTHRAIHKLLLNGITEHKDINDVYKTINELVKNHKSKKTSQFTDEEHHEETENHINLHKTVTGKQGKLGNGEITSYEEKEFLNELIKCEKLQKEIMKRSKKPHITTEISSSPLKDSKLLIKTIIEVKPLKSKKIKKDKYRKRPKQNLDEKVNSDQLVDTVPKPKHELHYFRNLLNKFKRNSFHSREQVRKLVDNIDENEVKRSKRQFKVKYKEYKAGTPKIKPVRKANRKADDELYVEIETHFDGTGARGKKKKKLIKNLIDKIQKAIRSDVSHENNKNKVGQRMQIKTRIQNPLEYNNEKLPNNYLFKMQSIEHRQLNPINRIIPEAGIPKEEEFERVENWDHPYFDPSALTTPNIEESEETNNPVLDFNNVLNSGIPQRVQVPLNTHGFNVNDKSQNINSDKGNVSLFIKDIDGSGFSVGFNQYVDDPPDVDSMKLFSGLENLIETYHENYDQNNNENTNTNGDDESVDKHELIKRAADLGRDEHILMRRSVQELNKKDYYSNAYKIIYDKYLPYKNYEEMLQRPDQNPLTSNYEYKVRNYDYNPKNIKIFTEDIKIKALPVILNNDVLDKNFKPSEIFGLASLLLNDAKNKSKRSMNVKRITNLRSRKKLNRYINTNDMQSKSIFLKNKRNKRDVSKIRIIASDHLHDMPKHSEQNIFLIPGENLFTTRAVLRETELPESDTGDEEAEDHNDEALPYAYEDPNSETGYITNIFDTEYRHNSLMSKYPHLFTTSVTESKELRFGTDNEHSNSRNDKQKYKLEDLIDMHVTENKASAEKEGHAPDIINAILPSPPKSNYKVTVKISPKNLTNAPSGFKEMHTVINKTYNNNGVQYYSVVNVSEISKIEKINKSKDTHEHPEQKSTTLSPVSEQKNNFKLLLRLQKQKIEQQLKDLNKQNENLESILREGDEIKPRNFNNLLKEIIETDTHKPDDEVVFAHEPYSSYVQNHNPVTVKYSTATTTLATEKPEPTTTSKDNTDIDKNKINTSIKSNENLTNEILSKINKNTDILQCFLKKLSDKFDNHLSIKTSLSTQRSPVEHITEVPKHLREHVDMPKEWGLNLHHLHDSFFNDHVPSKNDSHYAIPFVYAYQHPYLPQNKQPVPMAKIVYHGHIHTNALHKHANEPRNYSTNNGNISKHHHTGTSAVKHDGSKFFIDTVARDRIETNPTQPQKSDIHTAINATILY